jgi:hypothetical protein
LRDCIAISTQSCLHLHPTAHQRTETLAEGTVIRMDCGRGAHQARAREEACQAHADLDAAVAAAYGWTDGATMTDDDILRRLLALNRERAPKA